MHPSPVSRSPFRRSLGLVIGIDQYACVTPLANAVRDARAVGEALQRHHGYEVRQCFDRDATAAGLRGLLTWLQSELTVDDQVFVYFAGHGVVTDFSASAQQPLDAGPQGFFVPQDAVQDDISSLLSMSEFYQALAKLPARHLLLVLDCCFAGAFAWAAERSVVFPRGRTFYRERYERYVRDRAWQILASAAYDERACDVLNGYVIGERAGTASDHSPFATALLSGLAGEADLNQDGIVLASELYLYVESHLSTIEQRSSRLMQKPILLPLRRREKGEYLFFHPGRTRELPSAVVLSEQNNPYRGLHAYRREDRELFFGRMRIVDALADKVRTSWLCILVGPSGTGKSSLMGAGLLPQLADAGTGWRIYGPIRPGAAPGHALHHALRATDSQETEAGLSAPAPEELRLFLSRTLGAGAGERTLLVIDQFEELVTLCSNEAEREQFLQTLVWLVQERLARVLISVRLDFEPQLSGMALMPYWQAARFTIRLPSQDELREIIERPADLREIGFEPPELVDELINDVVGMPGALPLLSFTLSELYLRRLERGADDRVLRSSDYEQIGRVIGSLQHRIDALFAALPEHPIHGDATPSHRHMRQVMLRMVATDGGERARRRVPLSEFDLGDALENRRIRELLRRLSSARLLVEGTEGSEPYVEPAHDALINGWGTLSRWLSNEQGRVDGLVLQRRLTQAARAWKRGEGGLWGARDGLRLAESLQRRAPELCNAQETLFIKKSVARRRLITAALLALFAVLVVLLVVTRNAQKEAERQKERAQERQRFAEQKEREANEALQKEKDARNQEALAKRGERLAKDDAITQKNQAIKEGRRARDQGRLRLALEDMEKNPTRAALYLASVESRELSADLPEWRGRVLNVLSKPLTTAVLAGHHGPVHAARFSPDGAWVVTVADDGVRLFPSDGRGTPQRLTADQGGSFTEAVFADSGSHLAAVTTDGRVVLWQLRPLRFLLAARGHQGLIHAVAFSPDGRSLVTGAEDGSASIWSLIRPGERQQLKGHKDVVWSAAFTADSREVLTASADGTVRRWRAQDGGSLGVLLPESSQDVRRVVVSHDGKRVAAALWEGRARVWEMRQPQPLRDYDLSAQRVNVVAFGHTDSNLLLSGLANGALRAFWLDGKRNPQLIATHRTAVRWAELAPDDSAVLSLPKDDAAYWIRMPQGSAGADDGAARTRGQPLLGHGGAVNTAHIHAQGKMAVTASEDRTARVWLLPLTPYAKASDGELLRVLSMFSAVCLSVEERRAVENAEDAVAGFQACQRRSVQSGASKGGHP